MNDAALLARFDGPIVMIGFGSIGKGTLPLIERHIAFDRSKFVVIAPDDADHHLLDERQLGSCTSASRRTTTVRS
jgi:homospermidine synthase